MLARPDSFAGRSQDARRNCARHRVRISPKPIHHAYGRRSNVMTTMNLKGHWNEIKGKLKQKYGQLTDDDLTFAEGKEEELLGRLQKRLGKSKEDVRAEIERL
jgi:uncharacterized protein YjbJ (UPF0337 family)